MKSQISFVDFPNEKKKLFAIFKSTVGSFVAYLVRCFLNINLHFVLFTSLLHSFIHSVMHNKVISHALQPNYHQFQFDSIFIGRLTFICITHIIIIIVIIMICSYIRKKITKKWCSINVCQKEKCVCLCCRASNIDWM